MKKRVISIILICLCISGIGCGKNVYENVPELITPVGKGISETEVIRTDLYSTTVIHGEVLPIVTEYSFGTTGIITAVHVNIGDYVKEGDILAEIDSTEAQAEISKYQDAIGEIDNVYDVEINKLLKENEKPDTKWQTKELNELIISQYEKLKKEKTEVYEEGLIAANEKLSRTKIVATRDGRVTALNATIGRWASEGNAVLAVANESEHYIICPVIKDEVLEAAKSIFTLQGGNIFPVEFQKNDDEDSPNYSYFTAPGVKLVSGDYAPIVIISDYVENVVAVPNDCIYKESDERYVYVIADGTRIKTKVAVGFAGVNYTEIVEGISEGDKVYIKEEASTSSRSTVASRGDFAITTKVKAKTNYRIQHTLNATKTYGSLVFKGFSTKTYTRVPKGTLLAKYAEIIDEDLIAETQFSLEYAKLSKEWEMIAYYENMLEDMYECMGEKTIEAPCDGMIISVSNIYTGSSIPSDGKICVFAGVDNLRLTVDNASNAFRYGQTALIEATIDNKPVTCTGTVISASNTGLSKSISSREAVIELDPGNEELYFSNNVFASVNTVAVENVILIPVDATKQDNGDPVVLVSENGELRKTHFVNGRKGQSYYWAVDGILADQEIFY